MREIALPAGGTGDAAEHLTERLQREPLMFTILLHLLLALLLSTFSAW